MKKFLYKNWDLILIFLLSLAITWPLFQPGYFSHHDDLQVMRIFEMRKCFEDFQIPCRWVPDMGYGNGYPLFNYYGVFPYYLGALFSFIFGFILAAKVLFFIPLFSAGFSMYLLGREVFKEKIAVLTVACLYIFAPYRALDSYVRGAVAESFALALAPLIFYFSLRIIRGNSKSFFGFSFFLFLFLITHNIMNMIFLPILFAWSLMWLYLEKFKNWRTLFISFLLGFGLSAFFILPVFFEKNLVKTDSLTRFELDFRANFVSVGQLFLDRSWGYGASVPGLGDTISFQIGFPYWILVLLAAFLSLILFVKKDKKSFVLVFLLGVFLISVLMMHNKSAFIWEKIGILRFAQFPWRFLSLSIFSSSLIAGFLIIFIKNKIKYLVAGVIISLTLILNFNYFRPGQFYYNLTDDQKLSGSLWEEQQKASILDYLPSTAIEAREAATNQPIVISGETRITNFENRSNKWSFKADVYTLSKIEMPVYDFPNWQIFMDNQLIPHSNENLIGRISFELTPGQHIVSGYFENTLIRNIGNSVTLISFITLLFLFIKKKWLKKLI